MSNPWIYVLQKLNEDEDNYSNTTWHDVQKEILQDEINYSYDCLIEPFGYEEPFPDDYADTDDLPNNQEEDEDDEFFDEDLYEYEEFIKETSA